MARMPLATPFSGAALCDIRERAGLDLVSLARQLEHGGYKVHSSTLGKVEAEKHKPSPALLQALTIALKVSVDDLAAPPVKRQATASVDESVDDLAERQATA